MRGDCLSCARLGKCSETSVEKVLKDYTCVLFEPVEAPVYWARVHTMETYGDVLAVEAMLEKSQEEGDEDA